jgi:hypothetical protein
VKCSLYSLISCRKKADERKQQQACVELFGSVGLHETVKVGVKPTFTGLGVDFVGDLAPPRAGSLSPSPSRAIAARSNATHAMTFE